MGGDLRKIEGIERFMLVSCAALMIDIPQAFLTLIPFTTIFGWIFGILGSLIFGFILSVLGGNLLSARLALKIIPYLAAEWIPFVGFLPWLSVGLFVTTHFHNKHVEEREQELYNEDNNPPYMRR